MIPMTHIFIMPGAEITWEAELRTVWLKLPKLANFDFQTPCYVNFFSSFVKPIRYFKSALQTASEKNAGSKTPRQFFLKVILV